MADTDSDTNYIENARQLEADKPVRGLSEEPWTIDQDKNFIGSVVLRMQNADWTKYERGSDEFFDLDRDIERLSKVNPDLAIELWDKHVNVNAKKPFYLDTEYLGKDRVFDDKMPSASDIDPAFKAQVQDLKQVSELLNKGLEKGEELPPSIVKQYIAAKNKFFYRDQQNKLAFEDNGKRMITKENDPRVAASMVELAQSKGWSTINVSGHEDFKREVWLQASLKGLEVNGFRPKDVDLAKLEEMRGKQPLNAVERALGKEVGLSGTNEERGRQGAVKGQKEAFHDDSPEIAAAAEKSRVIKGKLVEHGKARYDFNDKNDMSYFVKVETPFGTKTHWGVDLERAVEAGSVKTGDKIEMEYLGRMPVTVNQKEFDNAGRFTGTTEIEVHRNAWRVDHEGVKRELAEPVLKGDYKVVSAVMADVLREKGYSAKNIDAAIKEAGKRLGAMQDKNIPAPGVKVFDKTAQREVKRDVVRSKALDKERTHSR